MNLVLPEPSVPGGSYTSVVIRGNIAYVSIQFPIWEEEYKFQGKLGNEITTLQGYEAMKICALNVLSQIDHKVGFDAIEGLNHLEVCYVASEDWDDAPRVADGASELFASVLGDKGQHTRAIFGVQNLPRNFSVGLTTSFTVSGERTSR